MRLGKIVTLLLAGFLTFSSLDSFASTMNTKAKSTILTKKHTTSKTTKKSVTKAKSLQEQHKNTARQHYQTGVASYYANKFNGRRTASGETFSNAEMTAAHKTLPFGTLIEVTNVRNGRSVIVRVNDRGPYVGERMLDLSSAAAKEIGMYHSGLANVKIAILNKNAQPNSSNEFYTLN